MFTIFDSSAFGNPKKWNASSNDTFNWPRLIHLTWQTYSDDYELQSEEDCLIKPEGFELDYEFEDKHHVKQEELVNKGQDLKTVLEKFAKVVNDSSYLISHNLRYNENIVAAEFYRKSINHRLPQSEKYCLMMECTYLCKLPNKRGGYKWPSLIELHLKCFGEKYERMHHALEDVRAAGRCYTFLMKNDYLDLF
ncbi:MAG: 3'-5' exonuclease [Bacteroidota bacterium]